MGLSNIYQKFVLISPWLEVAVRRLYWDNIKFLKRFRTYSTESHSNKNESNVDFEKIIKYLSNSGVGQNDIIVLHSSYAAISGCGLSAEQIIESILKLIGQGGTLAMPAIREFPEEGEGEEYILNYIADKCKEHETLYDVYRSKVSSGLLPFTLMRFDDAEISKFPLNPLVAVGAHASEMMKGNIEGKLPSAHGPNSSWAYCASHNAWNIGLGVGIKDYLTMFHITQETEKWPVKDNEWYFERSFIIKKAKREIKLRIKERKHKWTKYFAESNFYNDLHEAGIVKSTMINGVEIHLCKSNDLLSFISNQKNPTYPYLIPNKYLKTSNNGS